VAQEVMAAAPEVVILDHTVRGQPTLDAIDDLALQFPEIAVVAILGSEDPVRAQQAMLAGARGFLIQPFTQVNLLSTLRRLRELESRRRPGAAAKAGDSAQRSDPLQILTVYSPRGGTGASTLAVNLAIALREEASEKVLLMEGKLLFGHLGLMLNLRAPNSLADLIPHASALDPAIVKDVVIEHASGIHVLLSPSDLQVAQGIRPEGLFSVLRTVRSLYDFIVIDAGSALNDNSVTLMDAADRILLVATPELAALHDVSRFVHLSRSLAYPPGKVLVVLNRAGMAGAVRTNDIDAALHHVIFAQVPDDEANATRCLNRGIPLLFKSPRSPASRAIQRLARSLAEVGTREAAREAGPSPAAPAKARPRMAAARAG
jgi:pilus assembly protein CpaE